MSESSAAVDVLVGKIDPARVPDFSVDHGNLSVIAVVVKIADNGDKGQKFFSVDPRLFQRLVIAHVHTAHAADVVVHDLDFHALFHLPLQHVEHRVPKPALGDDEVFEEDIFLCVFEVAQKAVGKAFSRGEIFRFRIAVRKSKTVRAEKRLARVGAAAHFESKLLPRNVAFRIRLRLQT